MEVASCNRLAVISVWCKRGVCGCKEEEEEEGSGRGGVASLLFVTGKEQEIRLRSGNLRDLESGPSISPCSAAPHGLISPRLAWDGRFNDNWMSLRMCAGELIPHPGNSFVHQNKCAPSNTSPYTVSVSVEAKQQDTCDKLEKRTLGSVCISTSWALKFPN